MVPARAKISARRWANLRSDLARAVAASGLRPMLKTADLEQLGAYLKAELTKWGPNHQGGRRSARRWANLRSDLARAVAASGLRPMLKTADLEQLGAYLKAELTKWGPSHQGGRKSHRQAHNLKVVGSNPTPATNFSFHNVLCGFWPLQKGQKPCGFLHPPEDRRGLGRPCFVLYRPFFSEPADLGRAVFSR